MHPGIIVNIARAAFVMVCCLLGITLALSFRSDAWIGALAGTGFALFFVLVDFLLKNVTIRGFSSATFGLMVGILCAWLITRIGVFENLWMQSLDNYESIRNLAELMLYTSLGFLGITLSLRSDREEFSLIIPYVRFRREGVHDAPLLLDSNVIIDGRIPGIYETGFISGSILIPRFVVDEIQLLADSNSDNRRERGQRGLECIEDLQAMQSADVTIYGDTLEKGEHVDQKIIALARSVGARILTNDANLCKAAAIQNLGSLNLNELARALHAKAGTGDRFELTLTKKGREDHQAVGYLPDGTMIVVNQGIAELGNEVHVEVATSLQTSAGRLVFAEIVPSEGEDDPEQESAA